MNTKFENSNQKNKSGKNQTDRTLLPWASRAFANPNHGGTYFFLKVTAVILLLTASSYAVYYFNQSNKAPSLVNVSSGTETKTVNLSDGSTVRLEPASTLEYPEKFSNTGERVVDFRGEARFEIVNESGRSFVVHTGDVTATVIGTIFNMKSAIDTTEVYVLQGNVLLTTTTQKVEVKSQEKVRYIHATHEFRETTF